MSKKTTIAKKLVLAKETLKKLDDRRLRDVRGGSGNHSVCGTCSDGCTE